MTLQELLTPLIRDLQAAGTDAPALEARLLAGHVLRLDRIGLMLAMPAPVAEDAAAAIRGLTARRCTGEPLAHITGRREFFGRDFEVSPQTLIPRPETELLLEIVLRECAGPGEVRFADLGTGTGILPILLCTRQ
ncbi:N5-glutamine methyltransferase family protein, partial [Desulfovibrio piger]|uniref:N5-glutamine methyltransferase family protein n=1 Tax=Desulfovibrio piger TaxID=901 RepID=UPI0039F5FC1B